MKSLFSKPKKHKAENKAQVRERSGEEQKVRHKRSAPELANPQSSKARAKKQQDNVPSHLLHKKFTVSAAQYGISPKDFPRNALSIVEKLQLAGFEAYIVGGCIRDLLLEKKPKDFDIATNARPEEIQRIFGRQCRLIGRRFRLAHIVYGREIFEVATFRAGHESHRNDKISKVSDEGMLLRDNVYGTLRDDAERRDFTVNALYYDIKRNLIFDFFNGIEDLRAGKLSLIGEPAIRYQEDPVRMLRAVRFMAKLDMFLDKATASPIRDMAALLTNIPAARLFDESLKLLQTGAGLKTYQLLREYELWQFLFPVLPAFFTAKGDSYAERMITKALNSTDERIADKLPVNPAFLFAALLWYPLREKMEQLKNEGGFNSHDAMMLAANDVLAESCNAIALHRRHTSVIRDIWALQFQMMKRSGNRPQQTLEHVKFRAGFDLLVMRAEIEGGDLVELSAWWHEYQFSNEGQRTELLKSVRQSGSVPSEKKKTRRRRTFKKKSKVNG
ncbi:polynucleotide adenylyltransferase PcnB [Mannheimia haemolytica]